MCTTTPPEEWRAIGVAQWKGDLYVLEECAHCGSYRAARLDPDEIPIVENDESVSAPGADHAVTKTDADERAQSDNSGDGGAGDWLIE
jgi:hypothetical protein